MVRVDMEFLSEHLTRYLVSENSERVGIEQEDINCYNLLVVS